jgi:hypothetical protein
VHHGLAKQRIAARATVLATAYAAHGTLHGWSASSASGPDGSVDQSPDNGPTKRRHVGDQTRAMSHSESLRATRKAAGPAMIAADGLKPIAVREDSDDHPDRLVPALPQRAVAT